MNADGNSRAPLLARIAGATRLREGPEGVASVLRAAFQFGPQPLSELARTVRLPLPVATAVRRELEGAGLFERGAGGVCLTDAGQRFCATELGLAANRERAVPGRPEAVDGIPQALLPALELMERHLADNAPPVDVTLDQAPCTAETAIRRALATFEAGAVEGRSIALLGDDDSMSVAIPAVARELGGPPKRIAVFEIDPARCAQLEAAAKRHGFSAEIVRHDLRDPLAVEYHDAFDVFETDPPYTLDGMALFVSRGLEAVRVEVGLPGFLSYADLSAPDQHDLLVRLAELGLAPMRIRPSFNRYGGASILGSAGQLLDLRIAVPRRVENTPLRHEGPIYTGEVRPRLRRYRCRACNTVTVVGAGEAFATVEALKAAGCPKCGEAVFRREGLVQR